MFGVVLTQSLHDAMHMAIKALRWPSAIILAHGLTVCMPVLVDRILTYGTLLDVLWQMYHAWITYGTVRRIA